MKAILNFARSKLRLGAMEAGDRQSSDEETKLPPGINGTTDIEAACAANRALIGSSSKRGSKRCSIKRGQTFDDVSELVERLHLSIWPRTNMKEFQDLISRHPTLVSSTYGKNVDTLLHRASRQGKTEFIEPLMERRRHGLDIDAQNACGRTALHLAAHTLRESIVIRLLEAGADANIVDVGGDAPMHVACKAGSLPILKALLERSVCSDLGCSGGQGNTLLHYAARFGHLDLMEYLTKDLRFNVNQRNHLTETPLHLASGVHKLCLGTRAIEFLLNNGADPHARTSFGDTAAHYAALGGTLRILKFLVEEKNVSMSKDHGDCSKSTYDLEADQLARQYNLPHETCQVMKMSFLQKIATSSCIEKANWAIDGMADARKVLANNQSIGISERDSWIVIYQELSDRQHEFKRMAAELSFDMHNPDSALKIFLRCAPDCVEHLLNRCVVSECRDQVQGKVYFDFFLFYPPPKSSDPTRHEIGELTLMETLIEARKERFLTHPVFVTFLKLKWYRTWKLYVAILLSWAAFVVSLLGYVLTHFGNVLEHPLDPSKVDPWWYFFAIMTGYVAVVDVGKTWYFCAKGIRCPREQWQRVKKDPWLAVHFLLTKVKDVSVPVLSFVVLSVEVDPQVRRYVAAVDVVVSCFSFMLAFSRLPKVGIYIFMLSKVFGTIFNFFISYFWHFLGYAVAFHILMLGEDGGESFSSLGNSFIKVLTMLMGEYDFSDTFASPGTYWVSKVVFAVFVIDMSVVLMNLVLGLAVNDVDSIQQDSRVRSMVHETLTVTYLEQICQTLGSLPFVGPAIPSQTRIVNSNTCQFKEIVYLNLVDLNHNDLNELVVDRSPMGGSVKHHPCPTNVAQAIVHILKDRQSVQSALPDRKSRMLVTEFRQQTDQLHEKIDKMETQLKTLIHLVSDLSQQLNHQQENR